jgi:hypothetical protein
MPVRYYNARGENWFFPPKSTQAEDAKPRQFWQRCNRYNTLIAFEGLIRHTVIMFLI